MEKILSMIDCNNSMELQLKGIELAKNCESIESFILPMDARYNKNVWENCAKIISCATDDELGPFSARILEWLQDLNWPGTFTIIDRLKSIKNDVFVKRYIEAINIARNRDVDNQEWFDNLSVLIQNPYLVKNLDENILNDVKKRYELFWGKHG